MTDKKVTEPYIPKETWYEEEEYNYDYDYDDLHTDIDYLTIEPNKNGHFVIPTGYLIKNVNIELDCGYDDILDKTKLCDGCIFLYVDKKLLNARSILLSMFLELCRGQNITYDNDTMSIPIYNFDMVKIIPNNPGLYNYNYMSILISCAYKFKLIVCGCKINKIPIFTKRIKNLFLQQNQSMIYKGKIDANILLDFCYLGKALFIKYIHKHKHNEEYHEFPQIATACITGYNTRCGITTSSDVINYEADEILDINIFGIRTYIIPLCKNFSSWDMLRNSSLDCNGIHFSYINKVFLRLQYYNYNYNYNDDYNMIINYCNVNILEVQTGKYHIAYN